MAKNMIKVSDDFWNIRGSFKIGGVIDVGTQASLVRLAGGKFVFLDSYTLDSATRREVGELTDGGKDIKAILNVHPFHTVHVRKMHRLYPDAVLYGTATADAVWACLPLHASANTWGDEIYFDIALSLDQEPDARAEVRVGDLAYWPAGPAFCIFFGPTPVSTDDQPRAYSPVNVFGRVLGDATLFKAVSGGSTVKVAKLA